ncbi:hypothetical protein M8C21_026491, partial [Ambrosia artemisiifolia]
KEDGRIDRVAVEGDYYQKNKGSVNGVIYVNECILKKLCQKDHTSMEGNLVDIEKKIIFSKYPLTVSYVLMTTTPRQFTGISVGMVEKVKFKDDSKQFKVMDALMSLQGSQLKINDSSGSKVYVPFGLSTMSNLKNNGQLNAPSKK